MGLRIRLVYLQQASHLLPGFSTVFSSSTTVDAIQCGPGTPGYPWRFDGANRMTVQFGTEHPASYLWGSWGSYIVVGDRIA